MKGIDDVLKEFKVELKRITCNLGPRNSELPKN